jgi:hypothetical protein
VGAYKPRAEAPRRDGVFYHSGLTAFAANPLSDGQRERPVGR